MNSAPNSSKNIYPPKMPRSNSKASTQSEPPAPQRSPSKSTSLPLSSQVGQSSSEDRAVKVNHVSVETHMRHPTGISTVRPLGHFGHCEQCKDSKTGYNWCQYCNSEHFQKNFANWTSNNKELDKFIQLAQLKASNVRSVLEWVEYKEFTNVEHLADGGNSSVFTANWPQGPIQKWDTTGNCWKRGWEQKDSDVIILKRIKNSNNVTSDFLNELSSYHQFSTSVNHVVRCYGISRCPSNGELIVITSYARDGDLRQYLSKNFNTFTWQQKISTLKDIAEGLVTIHKVGLLHKDLHTGNILRNGSWTMISDLGLCWNSTSIPEGDQKVRGVLPYVAPEVLSGKPYTRAADVYSVGMIMFELCSGKRPFEGRDYDSSLVLDICLGNRPEIPSDIPEDYSLIMQSCWNGTPDMRPTSRDLEVKFSSWIDSIANRKLVFPPKVGSKSGESTPKSSVSPENTPSQKLPSLSDVQRKIVQDQEARREFIYRKYLDQHHLELDEQESKNKEPANPMTWTSELRLLADKIFGEPPNDLEIKSVMTESTKIGDNDNDNKEENKPSGGKKPGFLTKLLILLHLNELK